MKRSSLVVVLWNLAAVLFVLFLMYVGVLDGAENFFRNQYYRIRGVLPPDPRIVLVTIDQESVNEMGRYPWSRDRHAQLLQFFTRAGARAVIFDVLFTERDADNPEDDAELGRVAAAGGRAVFAMLFNKQRGGAPAEPLIPIAPLQSPEVQFGFVNVFPDSDGVIRRMPLWVEYNGAVMPSLALAGWSVVEGKTPEELMARLRPYARDRWNEALINFTGWRRHEELSPSPFPYHSFVDVLRGRKDPALFKDKIVIVGGTLAGLFDQHPVPNLHIFPGPEIQANALSNLLTGRLLREVPRGWTILLALALGLGAGTLMARASAWAGAATVLGWGGGFFFLCYYMFSRRLLLLDFAAPTLSFFLVYIVTLFFGLITEEREKRRIRETFARYMSPKLVDLVIQDRAALRQGNRDVSVFFSDVVNFTGLSEKLPPNALVEILNAYLSAMTDILFKYDVTFDKYVGDCIMAYWNAPLEQPGHAGLACRAALEQVEALPALHRQFSKRGWPFLDCRIGINTGSVLFGDVGSRVQSNYTVIGDTVNLASRLEGANKSFGTHVLISEFTYEAAKEQVEARELDLLRVKGKTQPVRVYELTALRGRLSEEQRKAYAAFADGLKFYRDRRFQEALAKFEEALRILPEDKPTLVYLHRCQEFLAAPPPGDWDGVYVMTSK